MSPADRRKNPKIGRCYELSANYVVRHKEAILVHGTIQRDPLPPNPHAWVELPEVDEVYDPVQDLWLSKDAYYRLHNACVNRRYGWRRTCELLVDTRNYGPWNGETDTTEEGAS